MTSPADPPEPRAAGNSLFEQLGAGARARLAGLWARKARPVGAEEAPPPARDARAWRVAATVGALIAAGPVATMLGAYWLAGSAAREAAGLRAQAAPRMAAARVAANDRATLAALLRRPGAGATVEMLARALPADATLVRVERGQDGLLAAEIATPDPDRLRAALRRAPGLGGLRDAGQRRGEAAMIVMLREAGQ